MSRNGASEEVTRLVPTPKPSIGAPAASRSCNRYSSRFPLARSVRLDPVEKPLVGEWNVVPSPVPRRTFTRFSDASAVGASGRLNVLEVTFLVTADPCLTTQVDLEVTSLFSADTFQDLLPAPNTVITMLREPVDRTLSVFSFLKQNGTISGGMPLEDFLESAPADRVWWVDNAQVRYLAGEKGQMTSFRRGCRPVRHRHGVSGHPARRCCWDQCSGCWTCARRGNDVASNSARRWPYESN